MSNKELTPHPKAEILRAIADGKKVQTRLIGDDDWWEPAAVLQYINDEGREFRIKPETMSINGQEFPAPVREPLKCGTKYWVLYLDKQSFFTDDYVWSETALDVFWLKRGLIQLTKDGAIAQARAIIAACGGEI